MKNEGEIFIDHRASPGIPPNLARRMGYEPSQVGEGKLFEAATMTCQHCHAVVIKNPGRDRERALCMMCAGAYICDLCDAERRKPDYVHMPSKKIAELVGSGEATVVTLGVRPILIPTKPKEI